MEQLSLFSVHASESFPCAAPESIVTANDGGGFVRDVAATEPCPTPDDNKAVFGLEQDNGTVDGANQAPGHAGGCDEEAAARAPICRLRREEIDALQVIRKVPPSSDHALVANYFLKVDDAHGLLPRCGNSFDVREILSRAGVEYRQWNVDSSIRQMVVRFACKMSLEPFQIQKKESAFKGQSLLAMVRAHLDLLEQTGRTIARYAKDSPRASKIWLAEDMGVPRALIIDNAMIGTEIRKRIDDGRLKLGEPFADERQLTRGERRHLRSKLMQVLDRHLEEREPFRSHPTRADKFWFDDLFDEAGIHDPAERDMMQTDKSFRRGLTSAMDSVGLETEHASAARGAGAVYAQLLENADDVMRQEYRSARAGSEINEVAENAWLANEKSLLRRFMRCNGRSASDLVAGDVSPDDTYKLRVEAETSSIKGNRNLHDSLDRWHRAATAMSRSADLPPDFSGALVAAMSAAGVDVKFVSESAGMPRRLLYGWRGGKTLPNFETEKYVGPIEATLGIAAGQLRQRMPVLRDGRRVSKRSHLKLDDGTEIRLAGWWRFLPSGSMELSDDDLRKEIEAARLRLQGPNNPNRVRMAAAHSNAYGLPDDDPTCPIWAEWDDLVRFKAGLFDDDRLQSTNHTWNSKATADLHNRRLRNFVRWALLASEDGGGGLRPDQISFNLVLNQKFIKRYVVWRITRASHLEVDGKEIGPKIVSTERDILGFFTMLLHPDFGWLTQSKHLLPPLQVIDVHFRVPQIIATKTNVEVIDDDSCVMAEVMPAEIVELANRSWSEACTQSRRHLRIAGEKINKGFKLIRDPELLVKPILRHTQPIAVMLRMISESLKLAPPLQTSPRRHAMAYARAVVMLLLTLAAFRSATLRNLTYKADGTGHVRKAGDHYDVIVEADLFKNCVNPDLFGPSWRRRDYERELEDWGGLGQILGHYIEHCRPVLLRNRKSDLLIPPPQGRDDWDESNFNYLVKSFTRMHCVFNPRTGNGMHGVIAFGPHVCRNIVATHIIRNYEGEERWALAALILATGVDQVKLRYGWISAKESLGKANGIFGKASDLAASGASLY